MTAGLIAAAPTGLVLAATTIAASDNARDDQWQGLSDQVPDEYAGAIQLAAADCPGLPAAVLAAQLAAESGFNPRAVSPAGAEGIAQFMPDTWDTWGRDADGDGTANPFDPLDAIAAQGALMCHLLRSAADTGWGDPIDLALAGYNAGWGAVTRHRGIPPYPETRAYVNRIRATAPRYAADPTPPTPGFDGAVDGLLPDGYRNGRSAPAAVAWALGQVGARRDNGYCLRFVARAAYQRPWDGGSIRHAHQVWDNAPAALRHPRDDDAPRGAVVLWDASIGGGSGHIAISLGDGRMITTTSGAVAIRPIRGFAPAAYLGWMPPYF
ncbi:MAG: transglycosylase SLT domain-containing protein, partial [Propionicimonas sp.]